MLLAGIAAILEFILAAGRRPLTASCVILLCRPAFNGFPHILWLVISWWCIALPDTCECLTSEFGRRRSSLLVLFGVLARQGPE